MKQESFDVVVIGSGFGGAVASCRLSQAGLHVLLLERGRRYEEGDFPALPASDRLLPDLRRWTWQTEQGLWDLQDLEELVSVQAAGYGGGSLIYANVHLRPPASVFDGAWPRVFRGRGALDPFFDLAASMLDVAPISARQGAEFVKTTTLRRAATDLGRCDGFFLPPLAVNYQAKTNDFGEPQNACDGCGKCMGGCPKRAKNTLDLNYLARAERHGASVRTQCEATGIVQKSSAPPLWRVDYTDHLSACARHVEAKAVFLCAGSVHSTRLLKEADLDPSAPRGLQDRVGLAYFPNADAGAIVYDTSEQHFPSSGPTITTTTVHWHAERDSFFLIQDGGYAPELERLAGLLRAPLWAGRNRLTLAAGDSAASTPAHATTFPGVALVSPLDAALDAFAEGRVDPTIPQQLEQSWPSFRRELQRPIMMANIVRATIDRSSRAKQLAGAITGWVARKCGIDGSLLGGLRGLVRWFAGQSLGDTDTIGDHALRGILHAADGGRETFAREVLGYDAEHAKRRLVLLAMGRDAAPGALVYDETERRLTADLDLFHLAPGYTDEERLMTDLAGRLGGELRVNPAFAFLGKPITVHSQGGNRMGEDAACSVTRPDGQVHGCPGLYVMDASVFCGSVGVNPSATILAIAEHNVLAFIRAQPGRAAWPEGDRSRGALEYIEHRDGATRWRARATQRHWQIEPPAPRASARRSIPIVSEPLGLRFREVMQGYCAPVAERLGPLVEPPLSDDAVYRRYETLGRPAHPVCVKLTATVVDLSVFIEDYNHRLELEGTISVDVPGLRFEGPCAGHLELFAPRYKPYGLTDPALRDCQTQASGHTYSTHVGSSDPSEERFMRYHLSFDRDRNRLAGYKRIRQDPGLDAWRDTSALFTQLGAPRRDAGGSVPDLGKAELDVRAAGVVHVDLTGFLYDQMRSFEVTGTTDPARISWAIAKFHTFFFGALQRVYAPELNTALQTLFTPKTNNVRYGA